MARWAVEAEGHEDDEYLPAFLADPYGMAEPSSDLSRRLDEMHAPIREDGCYGFFGDEYV